MGLCVDFEEATSAIVVSAGELLTLRLILLTYGYVCLVSTVMATVRRVMQVLRREAIRSIFLRLGKTIATCILHNRVEVCRASTVVRCL